MSWILRLLALIKSWQGVQSKIGQARSGIRQARGVARGFQERHVALALERAQRGDMEAQYDLGERCYEGRGVRQDYPAAAAWFRLAAEQGHAKAQTNLGMMLAVGRGAKRNRAQAMFWLGKAVVQGHAGAQEALEKLQKQRH